MSPADAAPLDDEAPYAICGGGLCCTVSPIGAEMLTLETLDGLPLLHDGLTDWTGRSPVLFPIVGALRDGHYIWAGQSYALPRHGFARTMRFTPVEHHADAVAFVLEDDEATRSVYPFAFRLTVSYRLDAQGLTMTASVLNPAPDGGSPLHASLGFHPAFRWPLPFGGARDAHRLIFAEAEDDALASVTPEGLIGPQDRPSPVGADRGLDLGDGLFASDALVWPRIRSRSLHYGVPGHTGVALGWRHAQSLGVWAKPGAPFVCVEPWAGHADPEGFGGTLHDKPGMQTIPPGQSFTLTMQLALISMAR